MPYADNGGVQIHYQVHGSGPDLVTASWFHEQPG